jgi:hypothetical protein
MSWAARFGQRFRALDKALQDFWERIRPALEYMAWITEPDPVLLEYYCGDYIRKISEMGLPPLSPEAQPEFLMAALFLQPGSAEGARAPLLQVATLCRRPDVAAAIIVEKRLLRRAVATTGTPDPALKDELLSEAYVLVAERIMPSLSRRVGKIPVSELKPRLQSLTTDAYLLRAIQSELRRFLGRHRKAAENVPSSTTEEPAVWPDGPGGPDTLIAIKDLLRRFASRPGATGLDRRLVQAFLLAPRRSARSLAAEWKMPERTVGEHRRLMLQYLRGHLSPDSD